MIDQTSCSVLNAVGTNNNYIWNASTVPAMNMNLFETAKEKEIERTKIENREKQISISIDRLQKLHVAVIISGEYTQYLMQPIMPQP